MELRLEFEFMVVARNYLKLGFLGLDVYWKDGMMGGKNLDV